jgi:Mlc titration factor MtfA (ptsG expression regulator)
MTFFFFVAAALSLIIYSYRRDVNKGIQYADKKAAPLKSAILPVPQRIRDILLKYFTFYQKLSPQNKTIFERKLVKFLYSKRFIPRNVPEVSIEAKVLISASAVQLTFGLPDIYLRHFHTILVYPDDYYSSITKRFHKGEVNPRFGFIVLSWQSFVDGYINQTDSFNVGLHEMAHALRLETIVRDEDYEFFDETLMQKLDDFAHRYCSDHEAQGADFIRPYACTNVHEFFSVSVENFFERPVAFKNTLPELYGILSRILNQDPAVLTET